MHRRKKYLIYKPGHNPRIDWPKVRSTRLQAWKLALRMGVGAKVMVVIYQYPAPRKQWTGSWSEVSWVIGT